MHEIEVKLLETDRAALEEKLRQLGAEKTFEGELHACLWDNPDGSIRSQGKTLRLRKEGKTNKLTFKIPIPHAEVKINRELEVEVSDFDTMFAILQEMGFTNTLSHRKRRISWHWKNVHFEFDQYLDDWAHIPEFMELEAATQPELEEALHELGYTFRDTVNWSTTELMRHYPKP